MAESRTFTGPAGYPCRLQAGIISKIRLENFMCHSKLEIELGDCVNFITGQNGSGKSAILTALCVAFGCRAKGTQRAATLKDFIKTGCSYAVVDVEIKNQGEDAFKPDVYGDVIIIERRISEATSSTALKNHQGRKVASRKEDLRELIEHFNIDVENPCVIMSQDKSREFLHSGNDKDKFKFFFKATLLHQVDELLRSIRNQLAEASELVEELESSIRPIQKELDELQQKIKNMEHVEEISQQAQLLKKKLAWSWVYDVDKQIQGQSIKIDTLKSRIPKCQARIDRQIVSNKHLSNVNFCFYHVSYPILHGNFHHWKSMVEEFEIEERLKELQDELDAANLTLSRLKEEESALFESLSMQKDEVEKIATEIQDNDKKQREIGSYIRDLRLHQTNKVTAFGGVRVTNLLQAIERHHHRFKRPPIGPIGAHVSLVHGDTWAVAVESAIGKLLNAFIVTDHRDSILLRGCAREAGYNYLQIIIYDFARPRLYIPNHMLPQTNHPTTISVIHSDNPTVLNVLVDLGGAERQVLVRNYDVGKTVAFDQKILNLKEVYTSEGYRMFSRGSAQTILPPNKKARNSRLSGSYDDQIKNLERDALNAKEQAQQARGRKRSVEEGLQELNNKLQSAKRRRLETERIVMHKKLALQDVKNSYVAEASSAPASTVDELHHEISKIQDDVQEKEMLLEKIHVRLKEAETRASDLKVSFENLCESAKGEIDAFEEAEHKLMLIEEDLRSAEVEKIHYEKVMNDKVLPEIKEAEAQYEELKNNRLESYKKASIICPESDLEALRGCEGSTPEQLSAQLSRLNQRIQRESERYAESIDDLKMLYQKKEQKILRRQQTYKSYRDKLNACQKAQELRWNKFQRNATLLKRQLTWRFNSLLGNKGISGHVKVSYEDETLSMEVKMPQDASNNNVRDTRGLSGGERSYSTLCFALALHEMTEAPFRAMDEFDVFMDAVSRKISLDALVDFSLRQGSQWIFITPHDISMVKQGERIKRQQMAAPRS
ncbi:structural maintenance of chromosomes protein 6B-like [Camellia sinensis]|uniref:structural maintenance of chromosomes protein 6B-like n=1 Tax=Camellia sinensis TaxID=4442 RepID=UPI001035C4EF|nr:structural maintenance of chromosomes protein 6B-like [Camellia sinensis]